MGMAIGSTLCNMFLLIICQRMRHLECVIVRMNASVRALANEDTPWPKL